MFSGKEVKSFIAENVSHVVILWTKFLVTFTFCATYGYLLGIVGAQKMVVLDSCYPCLKLVARIDTEII